MLTFIFFVSWMPAWDIRIPESDRMVKWILLWCLTRKQFLVIPYFSPRKLCCAKGIFPMGKVRPSYTFNFSNIFAQPRPLPSIPVLTLTELQILIRNYWQTMSSVDWLITMPILLPIHGYIMMHQCSSVSYCISLKTNLQLVVFNTFQNNWFVSVLHM